MTYDYEYWNIWIFENNIQNDHNNLFRFQTFQTILYHSLQSQIKQKEPSKKIINVKEGKRLW